MQFTVLRSNKTARHLTVQNKPFFTGTCSIGFLFNVFNSNIFINSFKIRDMFNLGALLT